MTVPELPAVTSAEVLADQVFFDRNPQRRYHLGERWVTRRRGRDTYLRAHLPPQHRYVDTEAAAERARWDCAWPFLSPRERKRMAAEARSRSKALQTRSAPARSAAPANDALPAIPKVSSRARGPP